MEKVSDYFETKAQEVIFQLKVFLLAAKKKKKKRVTVIAEDSL